MELVTKRAHDSAQLCGLDHSPVSHAICNEAVRKGCMAARVTTSVGVANRATDVLRAT
jgi:hypothetical protein